MKKTIAVVWLCMLLAAILGIFWYNAWVYALPTPVPAGYVSVINGTRVSLPPSVAGNYSKPVFLHFFNPDCPCSRFNIPQFKALAEKYGNEVQFVIVPVTEKEYTSQEIQNKVGLQLPVVTDTLLAARCGVYSTPQAVIINTDTTLFYRGNYNKSRYCTDEATGFARQALENLLSHKPGHIINPYALQAYGCALPKCTLQ